MKVALGIILGLLGGILLNLVIGSVSISLTGPSDHASDSSLIDLLVVAWTTLLWAIATFVLLFRAPSAFAVIRRGSIMGIALWALMIPFGSAAVARTILVRRNDPAVGGIASSMVIGVCVFMVIVCAACFVVVRIYEKRMSNARHAPVSPKTA